MRFLFGLIQVGLLVLFGLGYMAAYVRPDGPLWWLGLAGIGLTYVSAVLLITTAIALVLYRKRRRVILFHLLVLALMAVRFITPARYLDRPEPSPDDLTVMTFNLPYLAPIPDTALDFMLNLARTRSPDLIGFQETALYTHRREPGRLRSHAKTRILIDSLGYTSTPPGHPMQNNPNLKRWLSPVLARIPLRTQEQFEFRYREQGNDPLWVMRTEVEWQGRTLALYNFHLTTYGEDKPWTGERAALFSLPAWKQYLRQVRDRYRKRAWEAEQVRDLIDQESLPVVMTGDFNSTPHNWSYRLLGRGFQDAFATGGTGWSGTYHTTWPLVRIDHVLVGPEWEIMSAEVPLTPPRVSDHRPVVARIRWAQ